MKLLPIKEKIEENIAFINNPLCSESLSPTIEFYKMVGFNPPWISYYVCENENLIGACGFKGKPNNGAVEIAYGTFELHRQKGIGTRICKILVELSLKTDPTVSITARTLPENIFSAKPKAKNECTDSEG